MNELEGKIKNLSFDQKRIIRGWYLFISDDNKEYLIKQNNLLVGFKQYKIHRRIYQTNISLNKFCISGLEMEKIIKNKSEKSYLGIAIILPLGAFMREIIPKTWLWGRDNFPINILDGIINLILFWIVLVACLSVVSYWRKQHLEKELKKRGAVLKNVGRGYATTPLIITQKVLKWW